MPKKNNIILNINEKDNDGDYPLLWSIWNDNIHITHMRKSIIIL